VDEEVDQGTDLKRKARLKAGLFAEYERKITVDERIMNAHERHYAVHERT
jgi:hypothetical protein